MAISVVFLSRDASQKSTVRICNHLGVMCPDLISAGPVAIQIFAT